MDLIFFLTRAWLSLLSKFATRERAGMDVRINQAGLDVYRQNAFISTLIANKTAEMTASTLLYMRQNGMSIAWAAEALYQTLIEMARMQDDINGKGYELLVHMSDVLKQAATDDFTTNGRPKMGVVREAHEPRMGEFKNGETK
jgi:hypothetical protein